MRRLTCFDVDGTLVNTLPIVRAAYAVTGITMPNEAWGLPWQSWLPTMVGGLEPARIVHRQKVVEYRRLLSTTNVELLALPACSIARNLLHAHEPVRFMTSGTGDTAMQVLQKLRLPHRGVVGALAIHSRIALLKEEANLFTVRYVDDSWNNVQLIRYHEPRINVVHYANQSVKQLQEELDR